MRVVGCSLFAGPAVGLAAVELVELVVVELVELAAADPSVGSVVAAFVAARRTESSSAAGVLEHFALHGRE